MYLGWVSMDNIGYTWKVVEMIEDHILAASSFVDKGNIRMPKGWGDIDLGVFGLANRPAGEVGEDKVARSLMPVRGAGSMDHLGNIHMDNHQLEKVEMNICLVEHQVVERDGVISQSLWRPPLGKCWMRVEEEDTFG